MKFKAPLLASLFILINYVGLAQQFTVSGRVTDKKTLKPIVGAIVTLVGSDGSIAAVKTDSDGHYIMDAKSVDGERYIKPNTSYILSARAQDQLYLLGVEKANLTTNGLTESKEFIKDFILEKGYHEPRFPRVDFDKNSYTLSDSAKNEIRSLVKLMNNNPNIVIELDAHASPDETNPQILSQERADVCRTYMISEGVAADRMVAKGWGRTVPLPGCSAEDIMKMNRKSEKDSAEAADRRGEFRVLRFNYEPKK